MNLKKYNFLLIVIFIIFYFLFNSIFLVNFPNMDDYILLDFTNKFISADSIGQKISLLYSQHNEHRLVVLKIIALAQYYTTGEINFKVLIFVGNLFLIGIFYLIYLGYRNLNLEKYIFIPLLLLFNFAHWHNQLWALSGLPNYGWSFFSLLALYFVTKEKDKLSLKNFVFAVIFSIFSLYSFGAGISIFPVIFFYLISFKDKKYAVYYTVFAILSILPYFLLGYSRSATVMTVSPNIFYLIVYFFIFTGYLSFFIPFLYFVKITIETKFKQNWFFYLICLQIILIGILSTITRSGIEFSWFLPSRYLINPFLFIIAIFTFIPNDKIYFKLVDFFTEKKIIISTFIIVFLAFIFLNLQGLALMKYRWYFLFMNSPKIYQTERTTIIHKDNEQGKRIHYFGIHEYQDRVLKESIKLKTFNPL